MNQKALKEFNKRYDKFKKNNLPTPFYDEERQTLEYVDFSLMYNSNRELIRHINVNNSISDSLGRLTSTDLYYPYICGYLIEKNNELVKK